MKKLWRIMSHRFILYLSPAEGLHLRSQRNFGLYASLQIATKTKQKGQGCVLDLKNRSFPLTKRFFKKRENE